jgi:hypothetical protein
MTEMKLARQLATLLVGSAPAAAPSPRLRRRILASVGVEQRNYLWTAILAAAGTLCGVGAVYFSGRARESTEALARTRSELRQQTVELSRLDEAFSILNSAGTTVSTFGDGAPKGRVFVHPSKGILLIASNLPPAPAGKRYEMWRIPKGGKLPIPAGLFQSEPDGTAVYTQREPVDVAALGAVAVTLEDEAGAAQPTSTPLIVAALPQ